MVDRSAYNALLVRVCFRLADPAQQTRWESNQFSGHAALIVDIYKLSAIELASLEQQSLHSNCRFASDLALFEARDELELIDCDF